MLNFLKKLPNEASYTKIASPVGDLCLIATDKGLHAILWETDTHDKACRHQLARFTQNPNHPVLKKAVRQLNEYFGGKRKDFEIPLSPAGTEFQKRAWKELSRIPYGKTISYGEQAKRMGDAKKARAVGTANSRNPLSIIVPCHRVIASTGALSGFGGGVDKKEYLLKLEGVL